MRSSPVTSTHGMPRAFASAGRRARRPGTGSWRHLGVGRGLGGDRDAHEVAPGRPAGGRVDQVMQVDVAAPPAAAVAAGGGDAPVGEPEGECRPARRRPRATCRRGRPATARSPPALTRHGPAAARSSSQARSTAYPLAMPPRSSRTPGLELDPPPPGRAGRRRRTGRRPVGGARAARSDVLERAVVAGGDDRVVHGRVEPPSVRSRASSESLTTSKSSGPTSRAPAQLSALSSELGRKREKTRSRRCNSASAAAKAACSST